ncbi:hypothetical protein RRU94_06055 [Domibacillus sp. DTU_2020_1001157_1_SI_ALB_TIR_016]|uniref:hypothetical protein n=1 Tax=Domibacillus sp. DTU_2020_1001157_1_SI_ALB_TIR_016 TaxID=3077789 RepID=UPI0028E51AB5|nr:hypothetical protein [Domibacillus sp. DTU_2020_1001157_1_SI_ALB_TIR_016]WNS78031.1 hypothetical protein RRU94_06055 [Domibacillus sp. DTU_2020_1001157_1_SI_ALB_TIR_016]
MKRHVEEIIHLPDLAFIHFCCEHYGINRGVYNTIDSWFYEQGVEHVIERRRQILLCLRFIKEKQEDKNGRCKFGNGGLKIKLQEYIASEKEVSKKAVTV